MTDQLTPAATLAATGDPPTVAALERLKDLGGRGDRDDRHGHTGRREALKEQRCGDRARLGPSVGHCDGVRDPVFGAGVRFLALALWRRRAAVAAAVDAVVQQASPGVPGTAQGRARVVSSRRYG